MNNILKKDLMKEYFKRFKYMFVILEYAGFCRFTMKNGQINEITSTTLIYNLCFLIVTNFGAGFLIQVAIYEQTDLSLPEMITITYFTAFVNLIVLNVTFGDKQLGLQLVENCIDIDIFLRPADTEFMRSTATRAVTIIFMIVGITQIGIVTYMYIVFKVSMAIHVVGTIYYAWLFFVYDDYCFYVFNCLTVAMRARYLNLALMKITEINPNYVPKMLILHSLFWKEEYDDKVSVVIKETEDFTHAYRLLFKQLRCIERCYRFSISLSVFSIVISSFLVVQVLALYLKSHGAILRAGAILFGCTSGWFYIFMLALMTDMFHGQIEQTKLICAYAQLNPTNSAAVFDLTKNIKRNLEVNSARVSLFGVFFFNTSLTLKLAASTFVYITAQLQLTFPSAHETYDNYTPAVDSDDPTTFKRFLI